MKNSSLHVASHYQTATDAISKKVSSAVRRTLLQVSSERNIQENKKESISNGFYIPKEGTLQYKKWIVELDKEIESINTHNDKNPRKSSSSMKEEK